MELTPENLFRVSLYSLGRSYQASDQAPVNALFTSLQGCSDIICCYSNDVLSVPADSISSRFSTKATVGIMLLDVSIDNMVVGGPAYNCQHLKKGKFNL